MLKVHKPSVSIERKDDFEGKFIIEPLERGYGYTLGNSITNLYSSNEIANFAKPPIINRK